ncbi:type II toxin-antitoxin system RelE/ParE family toxin [Nostoc sp. CCCryo 231-06]|nr:type II toxin-antitoxin system RelE/ParE family toxin [Nostoc sp. CCCryo 231-06]
MNAKKFCKCYSQYSLPASRKRPCGNLCHIARDNPDAAEHLLDKLLWACELLTDNPRIGKYRYDLTPLPVRFWLVQPRYFLIYRGENPVEIVRVLAANMDIARELAEE